MRILTAALLAFGAAQCCYAQAGGAPKSTLGADFTGKDVRRGTNIWFSSVIKADGLSATPTTVYFRNSRLEFNANGIGYRVAGPNATVTFSPAASAASTSFDKVKNEYQTVVPLSFSGNVFLSGMLFFVPEDVGLKRRTGQAIWEGEFYSDTSGVKVVWQWRALAFGGGIADYPQISVKPTAASGKCTSQEDNAWYGSFCMSIGESEGYFPVATSGSSSVEPVRKVPAEPPIANAWEFQWVHVGTVVQLDGTHSRSLSANPLTYHWSFESTPDGRIPLLSGEETATPTFVPGTDGSYTLQLVVTDGFAQSSPSRVRMFSEAVPPAKWTFSMPDSFLLFWNIYQDLRLVGPNDSEILRPWSSTQPSLSRNGDLVAWGYQERDETARVVPPEVSLKSRKYLDTPLRHVLALYFVPERKVVTLPVGRPYVTYGDEPRDGVLDTAISPDGSKVVFTTGQREILVLDVATGKISPLATNAPKTVMAHHPSWSPDGARLVIRRDGTLSIFDLSSNATRDIGKGRRPAWSPTGEWIAYFDDLSQKCLLIRPDGTGGRTVKSLPWFSLPFLTSRIRFTDSPVWSPDGKKLLLNIFAGETLSLAEINEVVLVDVATGKTKRMRKHGSHIAGWAARKP